MPMLNQRGPTDVRNVLSGKDGALFSEDGRLLATVETFQTQVNVTTGKYQPLGDLQEHQFPTGYAVTLTFTQTVIEDDQFIQDLFNFMSGKGYPNWNFQGLVQGRSGRSQRFNYRGCVPSGNIDLQNLSIGDAIKRAWNLAVNEPPEAQSLLGL